MLKISKYIIESEVKCYIWLNYFRFCFELIKLNSNHIINVLEINWQM